MWEVFSRVLFPVDSFTALVVPTTCSLTTCLITSKGDRFQRGKLPEITVNCGNFTTTGGL